MSIMPTEEGVLAILRHGTPEERRVFARLLPPGPFNDQVEGLIGSGNPGTVVSALLGTIYHYCEGAAPEWGAVLAAATHRRAVELWQGAPDHHGMLPTTLSGLADSHCKALLRLGRSQKLLDTADRYIRIFDSLDSLDDSNNIPLMKVRRAEALFNLKRVDDAAAALAELQHNHPAEILRLQRIIDELKRNITEVKGVRSNVLPAIDPANAPVISDIMGVIIDRFGGSVNGSDIAVRQKIQQASLIFLGKPPNDQILKSLETLQSCSTWARQNSLPTLENEALWGLYLCFSRLDRCSDAADALIQLRKNLEAIRRGIADPQRRGGVFASHPHLSGALCEYLYKANRPLDLLEAIESSKGRAIADRLTEQAGSAVDDAAIYDRVRSLPTLAREQAFHYLSYFVDDSRIYAVLVTRQGEIHMLDPIPIARRDLTPLTQNVEPRRWGKPTRDELASPTVSTQTALAPLVAELEQLVATAVLEKDDHICYSTDDALHNVPLHYLRFKEMLLIDWFSLSRVHSAFHLDQLLKDPPARAPERYLGVAVGLKREYADPTFEERLLEPVHWLHNHGLEGHSLRGAEATAPLVGREALDNRIVHWSTHGMFPYESTSPFDDSYLLLADDAGLPDEKRGGQLSPKAIFAADLDFSGSHLSVMACISGLARQGVAGDALGLDWAFIQRGAVSLISAHWDVNVTAAARFFTCFYEHWIVHRRSRARAHRTAMLELLADDRSNSALNAYSAFSLTGDFR